MAANALNANCSVRTKRLPRARRQRAPHTWEEPGLSILDDRRGELPEFPLDTLQPKGLQDWVTRNARSTGTTVDHVAVPLLGGASSLIGSARRVSGKVFCRNRRRCGPS